MGSSWSQTCNGHVHACLGPYVGVQPIQPAVSQLAHGQVNSSAQQAGNGFVHLLYSNLLLKRSAFVLQWIEGTIALQPGTSLRVSNTASKPHSQIFSIYHFSYFTVR